MNELFYVEMKNSKGEYEPAGVMTLRKATELSWANNHAAFRTEPLEVNDHGKHENT